ncbi:MAG: MASE1 domain-containing protein [Pseudomonadota bacterium]
MIDETPHLAEARSWFKSLALAAFSFCYGVAVFVGNYAYLDHEIAVMVWPASGVLLSAFLLAPTRLWIAIIVIAIATQLFTNFVLFERSPFTSVMYSAANVLEPLLGIWLARCFGYNLKFRGRMDDVVTLMPTCGFVAPALTATIGAFGVIDLHPSAGYWAVWQIWWFSNVLGVLILAPPILTASSTRWQVLGFGHKHQVSELFVLILSLVLISWHVFAHTTTKSGDLFDHPYLITPLLVWAALRFQPVVATFSTLLVCVFIFVNAVAGRGPLIAPYSDSFEKVLAVQIFVVVNVATIIVLAVVAFLQRRSEGRLRQATEARRVAMESIHERYWRYDSNLRLEIWNAGLEGYTAVSGLERVGQPLLEELQYWARKGWHGPGDPDVVAEQRYQQYLDGTIPRFEYRLTDEGFWLEIRRYRTPDGGYTETQADITEKIKAEQAARENSALFEAFLRHSDNYITIKGLDKKYIHANESFLKLFNLTSEDVIGHRPRDIYTECFAREMEEADDSVIRTRSTLSRELDVDTPSGKRTFFVTQFPVLDLKDTLLAIGGIAVDVTQSQQQKLDLEISELRYRSLFDLAPIPVFEYDWTKIKDIVDDAHNRGIKDIESYLNDHPEILRFNSDIGNLLDVNQAAISSYGASDKQSFIQWTANQPVELANQSAIARITKLASGARRASFESIAYSMSGEPFHVIITSVIAGDDPGDWSRVYTSEQNITALKEMESKLRELAGQISLVEERERRRLASDLHDGTVQNLVVARMRTASLAKSLTSENEIGALTSIDSLLESSLIETRSLIFDLSPPVLYELGLNGAIEWLVAYFQLHMSLEVRIESLSDQDVVDTDLRVVLFQAIRELMMNVYKHAKASQITVKSAVEEMHLIITVSDNGSGFDPSKVETSVSDGGFGLFSLQERLKLLHSTLSIESSDTGTVAKISAPCDHQASQ